MEPKKVGRALGIGVRVASNMVRERVERAGAVSPPSPAAASIPSRPASAATPHGHAIPAQGSERPRRAQASTKAATAKRGFKAFGQALWGPFTHAGSILWLEITGLFFALFGLFFIQSAYRVHTDWRQGPEHTHLMLYTALAAAFLWFSASSFLRAYRKSRRGPLPRS